MSILQYNEQAVRIWSPLGFAAETRLNRLSGWQFVQRLKLLQSHMGLKADGICGPLTIAALARRDYWRQKPTLSEGEGVIIVGARAIPIWAPTKTYLDDDWSFRTTKSDPRQFALRNGVIHYDVTNSVKSTNFVLWKRNLSTHFCVAADGTLYQFHNVTLEACRHAGKTANKRSIGIDLNNPALRQYERTKHPRPEVIAYVHGRRLRFLDYWADQIDTFMQLMYVLQELIPIQCPKTKKNKPVLGTIAKHGFYNFNTNQMHYQHSDFEGWYSHFHITERKIDAAPFRWTEVFP
jgi:hypothetical protein